MLDFLRSWIINIVTISIILILFEIIIPSGKIKKIINLVSGFILLIAVINPFLTLKNKGFDLSEAVLTDSFYIDKKEIETGSKLLEETQMKQISGVYKKKLIDRIEGEAKKIEGVSEATASVEINEDYSSENFGEINKITVEIKKGKKQELGSKIEPVISVKKVDIKAPLTKKDDDKTLEAVDPEDKRLTEMVKKNLNKSLEIAQENIVVTVV